ncbi:MAG: ABC transporter ATP-binding protein/permease [Thermoanaerobaculia bacterium]|nr:ABC transporter ATP-binding protein/permease [Thermoanaerobaculia bacterium]
MNKLKSLLPYFRPYRRRLGAGILCIFTTAGLGLVAPQIVGSAIDAIRRDVSQGALLQYAGLLVGVTAVAGSFSFLQRYLLVSMSRNIEYDLLHDFYDHLQKLPASFFQENPVGDLMARATNDVGAVRMVCGPAIMYSTNTLVVGLGAAFFMLRIHVGLTLLALISLPAVAVITKVFGQKIHQLFEVVQERYGDLSSKVQENLSGARVVRAYVREDAERREFREQNRTYVDSNRHLIRWNAVFQPLIQTTVGIGFAVVLWFGVHLILNGQITVGEYVTFNLFLGKMVWPMIAIGWVINLAQRAAASMGRLQAIFDTEPAIRDRLAADGSSPLAPPRLDGAIRFRDLTFTYQTTVPEQAGRLEGGDVGPALRNVDLEIPAGRTVAIVGRTGSGKSTLLQLVPRLLEPPEGSLEVDGHDVHRLRLDALRGAIAMVPQETFLFSASVRHNIAFGRPDLRNHDTEEASRKADEEIRRAATLAGLDADLEGFPQGLDTLVGERGITLSGGQKQRVALARAILCDPQILLLDDCLSAVDAQTEEQILDNLRTVFPGRTVLLASHRIAAARLADRIVVLERGQVTAEGSHEELVAAGGLYSELHERQRLEDQLAAV